MGRGAERFVVAGRALLPVLALLALVDGASAQDTGPAAGQAGTGVDRTVGGAGQGPTGAVGANAVDRTQGGVAGTGMGKGTGGPDAPGTGQSVKGPAGQGIPDGTKPAP